MVVWGASAYWDNPSTDTTGGRYDPLTDTWTPTSQIGVPVSRSGPTAVWTGDVVIFWGEYYSGDGTPDPCNCCTGGNGVGCDNFECEQIVCDMDSYCCDVDWDSICDDLAESRCTCCTLRDNSGPVKTGGRYDPDTDTWLSTATSGAPSQRSGHTAVWTGDKMVVWGGVTTTAVDTGGRYDPVFNTWSSTSTFNAPVERRGHTAVWTGSEMIVWGGWVVPDDAGGRYDPAADQWQPATADGAPGGYV